MMYSNVIAGITISCGSFAFSQSRVKVSATESHQRLSLKLSFLFENLRREVLIEAPSRFAPTKKIKEVFRVAKFANKEY